MSDGVFECKVADLEGRPVFCTGRHTIGHMIAETESLSIVRG